jgi:hypothetical protein
MSHRILQIYRSSLFNFRSCRFLNLSRFDFETNQTKTLNKVGWPASADDCRYFRGTVAGMAVAKWCSQHFCSFNHIEIAHLGILV